MIIVIMKNEKKNVATFSPSLNSQLFVIFLLLVVYKLVNN